MWTDAVPAKCIDEEKAIMMNKRDSTITKIPDIKLKQRIIVMLGIINVFLIAMYFVLTHYAVKNVQVDGNKHYSAEEIKAMVMTGYLGDNSLYLSLKYKNKGIEGVPFVETMDVVVQSNDTIRITVYEKALAGYIQYLGRYMYFDNEGVVVESSKVTTKGIPQVTGLKFDHVILHEPLPVENPEIFSNVLNITQQLDRYSMSADRIYFDSEYRVTLLFGEARVALGDSQYIDEKIMKLQYILPELAGKKGTLDMREYSEDTKSYSFEQD